MSVGINRFDRQHRQILRMVDLLRDSHGLPDDSEEFSDLLTQLTEYSNTHLRDEEKLLEQHGYPRFMEHRHLHQAYRKAVVSLCLQVMNRQIGAVATALDFLENWWTHHILEVDSDYAPYFRNLSVQWE